MGWTGSIRGLVIGCFVVLAASLPASSETSASRSSGPEKSLQARAADPTELLIQASLFYDLAVSNRGGDGAAHQILLQPVIPLPALRWFPVAQIVRPSLPVINTPDPGSTTGLGDLTLFDLFVPKRTAWGAIGVGPVFVFPTATSSRLGAGKWQIGPAATLIVDRIRHFQLGVILQNPISIGGAKDRESVNQLLVQPILQYNLPDGWYVSMGDFTWTFDWENGGAVTIPIAIQAGRVMKICGHQWNLAVEPFFVAAHDGPGPRWGFRFGLTLLLPE